MKASQTRGRTYKRSLEVVRGIGLLMFLPIAGSRLLGAQGEDSDPDAHTFRFGGFWFYSQPSGSFHGTGTQGRLDIERDMLIDKLAAEAGATVKRKDCRSLIGSATLEDERVHLVKPQTFMNLSGEAVACLVAKAEIEDVSKSLIVISDDLALPFGTIRLRERGSAGGHNGLKSIIGAIGTNEFMLSGSD